MTDAVKFNQTRDGRKARILATDVENLWHKPLLAAVRHQDGLEHVYFYYANGRFLAENETSTDLVYVAPRVEKYANVYRILSDAEIDIGQQHDSLQSADRQRSRSHQVIGQLKFIYEDGKLVDFEKVEE